MKLGIVSRFDKEQAIRIFKETLGYLLAAQEIESLHLEASLHDLPSETWTQVFSDLEQSPNYKEKVQFQDLEDFPAKIILTIGGDGTILRTIHRTDKQVLPINAGILGFLTELDEEKLGDGLGSLLDKKYFIDSRTRLKTTYKDHKIVDAVNEAVIHTAQVAKIRGFRIYVDGFEADTIRADGIIIATATGSTCYAMSAGAPILDPKVPAFTIVPISSFTLATRPLVVPESSEIRVEPLDGKESLLVIDGQQTIETDGVTSITFTRSPKQAEFIRFERNFYRRVWNKLIKSTK